MKHLSHMPDGSPRPKTHSIPTKDSQFNTIPRLRFRRRANITLRIDVDQPTSYIYAMHMLPGGRWILGAGMKGNYVVHVCWDVAVYRNSLNPELLPLVLLPVTKIYSKRPHHWVQSLPPWFQLEEMAQYDRKTESVNVLSTYASHTMDP